MLKKKKSHVTTNITHAYHFSRHSNKVEKVKIIDPKTTKKNELLHEMGPSPQIYTSL